MELSINQIQQLDYLLKLMSFFYKGPTKDNFPEYQLVVYSDVNQYIGNFIEFANEDGTLLRSVEFDRISYRSIDLDRIQSLKTARDILIKRTGLDDLAQKDIFPYHRLTENPDIFLGFLIGIIKDVNLPIDKALPTAIVKNVSVNDNDYPCLFFGGLKCTSIGLIEAKIDCDSTTK